MPKDFENNPGGQMGEALGRGLQALAQHTIQRMQERHNINQLGDAYEKMGYPRALAYTHPSIQKQYISTWAPNTPQEQQEQQSQGGMEALQAMQQPQQMPSQTPDQLFGQFQPSYQGFNPERSLMDAMTGGGMQMPNEQQPQFNLPIQQQPVQQVAQPVVTQTKASTPKVQAAVNPKMQEQIRQFNERQKVAHFNAVKQPYNEILSLAQAAEENIERLDRIATLDKKGELQDPLLYSTLNRLGLDIPALRNADTQEVEKLSADFLKGARAIFGARVTNYEMVQFLKTIPNLMQTPEGRARVIRNLRLMNQAAILRRDAMQQIIEEKDGDFPLTLRMDVEKRIHPELKKIAEQFKMGAMPGGLPENFSPTRSNAAEYVGMVITNDSGQSLKSNGTEWVKV